MRINLLHYFLGVIKGVVIKGVVIKGLFINDTDYNVIMLNGFYTCNSYSFNSSWKSVKKKCNQYHELGSIVTY